MDPSLFNDRRKTPSSDHLSVQMGARYAPPPVNRPKKKDPDHTPVDPKSLHGEFKPIKMTRRNPPKGT